MRSGEGLEVMEARCIECGMRLIGVWGRSMGLTLSPG